MSAVSFIAHIAGDVLEDVFMHAIANAMAIERLDAFEHFFDLSPPNDPAIAAGFTLAKEDVLAFLEEDVSAIQSVINSFESHGDPWPKLCWVIVVHL